MKAEMPGKGPAPKPEPIEFKASVAKIQTLADGGTRVLLDLPDTEVIQAMALMPCVKRVVFNVIMDAEAK